MFTYLYIYIYIYLGIDSLFSTPRINLVGLRIDSRVVVYDGIFAQYQQPCINEFLGKEGRASGDDWVVESLCFGELDGEL